jgi:RNA polymerase sigma-70 factor (ECF subfamily)
MLGDVYEADDALQETLVRAWRHLSGFQPEAPVRAWLYRIATNVCLTAIERRSRRHAREVPMDETGRLESAVAHMTPYPDQAADVVSAMTEPGSMIAEDETLQLAFVAAGQLLPPRQRAILLLRDVLDFTAAEVAAMLGSSPQAVNSALQRARATILRERETHRLALPHAPASGIAERDLAQRFAAAWNAADVGAIVRLLATDALLTMPPEPLRVRGDAEIGALLVQGPLADGPTRSYVALQTRVNGQPALALYRRPVGDARSQAYAVLALSINGRRVASLTRFTGPQLFERLGLPARHSA